MDNAVGAYCSLKSEQHSELDLTPPPHTACRFSSPSPPRSQEGRPIYIERLGLLDIKALYAITTQERQLKRLVYEYEKFLNERLPACSKAVGHPVETSCTILDLHNVSLSNFYRVKDYVMEASKIGQDRYPETMGKFYIVNAPWGFSTVWSFIKPWLDEATVAKIDILGSGYKESSSRRSPLRASPRSLAARASAPAGAP